MASEEKNSVAALRAAVNKSEADVCRLETILNVKHQPVERHLPLVERERQLSEMSMLLSTTLSNRIDCFNALIEEQQRLGKQLGESVRGYTYETAPSLSLLQARNSIKSSGQHAYVGDVRTSSSSIPLNRVLPNPPDSDCGDKNFSAHKDGTAKSGESLVTKNSDNQTVAERVAAFRNAYLHSDAEHENSVKAIFISRLSELHKLFDECLVDYKIRERYPKQPADISLSSDYLDHIEEQIAKWQDYRTLHTDVMAAFFSWRASFARLLHIESQINDPKMRLRRSSLFLRLEKEAASVKERILPNLEKQLFVAADKDEGFLVFGVPVQQYVEEARREADQAEPGRPGLNPEKQAHSPPSRRRMALVLNSLQPAGVMLLVPRMLLRLRDRTLLDVSEFATCGGTGPTTGNKLIPKDTSAARSPPRAGPPPAKKPRPSLRATSRVPTQSPSPHRPGLAKVAPIPKGRPLTQVASRPPAPGLSTPSSSRPVRTKGISDRNQSASKIACPPTPNNNAKLATPIGRPPTARKPRLNNTPATATFPATTPSNYKTVASGNPSQLRTPVIVNRLRTPAMSASSSHLSRLAPNLTKLLEASPSSLPITRLFGYNCNRKPSSLKPVPTPEAKHDRVSISSIKRKIATASASIDRHQNTPLMKGGMPPARQSKLPRMTPATNRPPPSRQYTRLNSIAAQSSQLNNKPIGAEFSFFRFN
ncbi:unnamed protein product [Mesocestoides corti]|uniref:Uncharacterized protein n=1 Tax=Mesocestoides corti TaxID=53468 RepID=A0A0R3UGF9_MESCO|nr:unnamed protein product [Mesocestoides corti]